MNFLSTCTDLFPVVQLIKAIIWVIRVGVPAVLILLIIIDLGKAVLASKEDEMKKAQGTAIKRLIYALIIFFVPWIVRIGFGLLDNNSGTDMDNATIMSCWDCADSKCSNLK